MKKIVLSLLATIVINTSYSQVVTSNTNTVANYVQNVLLGGGVTVSNITFNGGPSNVANPQFGEFTDATSSVGLSSGVILGTGDITLASQPNIGTGSSLGGTGNSGSDPDLTPISTAGTFDEGIIEFDFIPVGDTLTFNYVFASEEYEEYVCSGYNDVFGFFLTGNNPLGGTYNAKNIALVPDPLSPGNYTTTAVAINTINPGVAGAYGSAATCAAQDPNWTTYNVFYQTNPTTNYEYDGRTTVLTAFALVNCGETYHIKLAIADAGDAAFDSGVFLEEGSFSANGTLDALTAVVPPDVTLCLPPYNVNFSAGPTPPPNSYWDFGDGIGTSTQPNPTYTYGDTGTYVVTFIASDPSACITADTAYFTVTVNLNDSLDAQFLFPPYDPCVDSLTIQLDFTGTGADSLFWDMGNGSTFINDTSVTYTYTVPGTYVVTLEAYDLLCNNTFVLSDTVVYNPNITTVNATPPPNMMLCSAPYNVNFTGNTPTPPNSYWDFGDGLGTDTAANPLYTYADTGTYNVMYVVIDSSTCNIADTAYFNVTINQNDSLNAQFNFPIPDPCADSMMVQLNFTGSGADSLFWDMGNGTTFINDTSITYYYTNTGTYIITFEAYDLLCNNTFTLIDTVEFNPVYSIVNATPPPNMLLCSAPYNVNFTGNTPNPPNSYWDFGDGLGTSTQSNPLYTYADTGTYNVMYVVIDSSTCNIADTAYFNVTVSQNETLNAQFNFPPYDPCTDSLTIQLDFTGSGADSLYWNMGNGATFINDTSITYTYTTPGTYIVTFQAYDFVCNNTATITDTVFFNPNVTTINVVPPPPIVLCTTPLVVDFTGNTPSPPNSYWDFGDGVGTSTQANPSYTYATDGIYTVMYVAIDSSTCNISDTITFSVTLIQAPPFSATVAFEPPKPCETDSFTVELKFTGVGADSILWNMGDGTLFTSDSIFYLYPSAGIYSVSLTAYNAMCGDKTLALGDVEFIELSESTSIIPNVFTPNGDGWNDELEFVGIDQNAEYSIKIYNRWGRKVYEGTDALAHWDGTGHDAGVYFYVLKYTDLCSDEEKIVNGYVTLLK
ncbi:MAG: hypothetical protein CO118_12140 [Flavobacteriales bacterium CG_4_9_14_3_um_filter_32_8]|nr:MAG: hypothetical protein CO118_12140 [Flavobacteriales bacterium CG_4_9_14_3_um_filter_32_8]